MKAISVYRSSKFIILASVVLSLACVSIIFVLEYFDLSPSSFSHISDLTMMLVLTSLVFSLLYTHITNFNKKPIYVTMPTLTMPTLLSLTCFLIIASITASSPTPYYHDCNELSNISGLDIYDCIEYATANSKATGSEIVGILSPEFESYVNVLNRPLNP